MIRVGTRNFQLTLLTRELKSHFHGTINAKVYEKIAFHLHMEGQYFLTGRGAIVSLSLHGATPGYTESKWPKLCNRPCGMTLVSGCTLHNAEIYSS